MNENTKRMLAGKTYWVADGEITGMRNEAVDLCYQYNQLNMAKESDQAQQILNKLIPHKGISVYMDQPIQFDYGRFTTIGNYFYANHDLKVIDPGGVEIGNNVLLGPNVSIISGGHPLYAPQRLQNKLIAKKVKIGNAVWIGANVTVNPGVTIGDNCVIGSGSVVTRDIPANFLAYGNPARPVRLITEKDKIID